MCVPVVGLACRCSSSNALVAPLVAPCCTGLYRCACVRAPSTASRCVPSAVCACARGARVLAAPAPAQLPALASSLCLGMGCACLCCPLLHPLSLDEGAVAWCVCVVLSRVVRCCAASGGLSLLPVPCTRVAGGTEHRLVLSRCCRGHVTACADVISSPACPLIRARCVAARAAEEHTPHVVHQACCPLTSLRIAA